MENSKQAHQNLLFKLRKAAADGELQQLKRLLSENQLDINASGAGTGKTALHYAVLNNHTDIVEFLLEQPGIKLIKDITHKTPFDYAREAQGAHDIIRLLCRKFTNLRFPLLDDDLAGKYGSNLFFFLKENLDNFTEEVLLKASQELIKPNQFYMGYSFLFLAQLFSNKLNFIELLINAGEDPNTQARPYQPLGYQNTLLHAYLANENKNEFIIEYLTIVERCNKQIDFTIQDDQGKTSLLLAAKIRRPAMVKALLERGAAVAIEIPDKEGRTILHIACALGDVETFELLADRPEFESLAEKTDLLGRTPHDMLNIPEEEVRKILKSIYINPDRDLNAPLNNSILESYLPAKKTIISACLEGRENIKENFLSHHFILS